MKNFDNVLNDLVANLLSVGHAEFSKDGLKIKTVFDEDGLKLVASFISPKEDENKADEYVKKFEDYIKSLSDDFFLEVVESFPEGALKKIQDKLDSKELDTVVGGIAEFMNQLRTVAASKVNMINEDIRETEKELSELIEIRDSYVHVLNKKF